MTDHLNREARAYSLLLLCNLGPVAGFRYVGLSRADGRDADEVEVVEAGVTLRLFLAADTKQPLKVVYRNNEPSVEGNPTRTIELSGSDYRSVDGILLPHQLTRSSDGTVQETLVVEQFALDVLRPEDFRESSAR